MKRLGLLFLCVAGLAGQIAQTQPFSGTIFIDPDIITSSDPTTFTNIVYAGQGMRTMYDRRVNQFIRLNAYLFNAAFDDGLVTEIQVNPEFGNTNAAFIEANKYAIVIGRLPTTLRSDVETVWIHMGLQPFGGGNKNLLIHIDQADLYVADGILEETFVHEASHTSLDNPHANAPDWLDAQAFDPNFISTYARDNPTREDIAESFLPWLAVRHRLSRITAALAQTITSTIPNRLSYFDSQNFDMYPIVPGPALSALVSGADRNRIVLSWPTNAAGFKLQSATSLGGTTEWLDSTNIPVVIDSRLTVTNIMAGTAQFYRLKKP